MLAKHWFHGICAELATKAAELLAFQDPQVEPEVVEHHVLMECTAAGCLHSGLFHIEGQTQAQATSHNQERSPIQYTIVSVDCCK